MWAKAMSAYEIVYYGKEEVSYLFMQSGNCFAMIPRLASVTSLIYIPDVLLLHCLLKNCNK